jgi:hypothetical protein
MSCAAANRECAGKASAIISRAVSFLFIIIVISLVGIFYNWSFYIYTDSGCEASLGPGHIIIIGDESGQYHG